MKIYDYEVKGIRQTNHDYNHNKHLPFKKIIIAIEHEKKVIEFWCDCFLNAGDFQEYHSDNIYELIDVISTRAYMNLMRNKVKMADLKLIAKLLIEEHEEQENPS